jgi:hypothetical protein
MSYLRWQVEIAQPLAVGSELSGLLEGRDVDVIYLHGPLKSLEGETTHRESKQKR